MPFRITEDQGAYAGFLMWSRRKKDVCWGEGGGMGVEMF